MGMVDAQFTVAHVLKPFPDFEDVYQGESPDIPIMFHPEDPFTRQIEPLDPQSEDTGYDDQLLRYVGVPMGSRVLVWIPHALGVDGNTVVQSNYRYYFFWRIRNLAAMRAAALSGRETKPYHSRTYPGRQDNSSGAAVDQFLIPAATRSVVIGQAEPAGSLEQNNNLRRENIVLVDTSLQKVLPYLPDGTNGHHQQGVLDPNAMPVGSEALPFIPRWIPFWMDAEGDEFAMAAVRADAFDQGADNWNFDAADDAGFSSVYGRNQSATVQENPAGMGIYVFTGTAP